MRLSACAFRGDPYSRNDQKTHDDAGHSHEPVSRVLLRSLRKLYDTDTSILARFGVSSSSMLATSCGDALPEATTHGQGYVYEVRTDIHRWYLLTWSF